jgi:hypothetical protein
MYELTLLRIQVRGLQIVNDMLSKRRKARKTRIRKEGLLNVQEV